MEQVLQSKQMSQPIDTKRRTLVKALLWRVIGIVWTWVGAYIILMFIPEKYETAAIIATLIVVYHHSTRMIMYYFYERLWLSIKWGRTEEVSLMNTKKKALWSLAVIIAIVIIFYLLMVVTPIIKS